jgi:uncharacterized protein with GYD domain
MTFPVPNTRIPLPTSASRGESRGGFWPYEGGVPVQTVVGDRPNVRSDDCGGMTMSKYLLKGSYSSEGVKGLLMEGGTARLDASRNTISKMGGEIESFYYAFGDNDLYIVVDMPDNATMAAVSLAVAATGAVHTSTVALLTPQEIDEAGKKHVSYQPPSR